MWRESRLPATTLVALANALRGIIGLSMVELNRAATNLRVSELAKYLGTNDTDSGCFVLRQDLGLLLVRC